MLKSMTGFGQSQVNESGYQVTCEIKSVNHRFLDLHIRIPRRYTMLEEKIKNELKKRISRGRIEVNFNIERTEESRPSVKLDKELTLDYYKCLKDLAEILNIPAQIHIIELLGLPEVIKLEAPQEDLEMVWLVAKKCMDEAIDTLIQMRIKEGQNLAKDICCRNQQVMELVEILEQRSPQVTVEYTDRLRKRIEELIGQDIVDEQRIIQEAAIFADRSSITEELVRLKSHISHLDELIQSDTAVGRKCDFLLQEMFREINTVASKGNDLVMSKIVVEVKAELEKIREQLQNIE
ncbi:MAG: YicC/YloC family endoribonuclease [Syntrophomonadaceae bacterium]|jgi:uncharacterized protein (TIGR00255 family)